MWVTFATWSFMTRAPEAVTVRRGGTGHLVSTPRELLGTTILAQRKWQREHWRNRNSTQTSLSKERNVWAHQPKPAKELWAPLVWGSREVIKTQSLFLSVLLCFVLTLLQVRPSPCNVPWQFQTMLLVYKSFGKKYILFSPKSFPKVLTWTSLHWVGPNVMYAQLPWPRACSALIRWSKITCPLLESESPTEGHELWGKHVVL